MSSHTPEDLPPFDFETTKILPGSVELPTYDPEILAETVLWPIVDKFWNGNFRQEYSSTMPPFSFPKSGYYENRKVFASIEASFNVDSGQVEIDGEIETVWIVTPQAGIRVEIETPELLENLISMAQDRVPEEIEELIEQEDADSEPELFAFSGAQYYVDEYGKLECTPYYLLKDQRGNEILNTEETEGEGYDEEDDPNIPFAQGDDEDREEGDILMSGTELDGETQQTIPEIWQMPYKFDVRDIDMLLAAAAILGVPDTMVEYLQKLKKYPELGS